MILGSMMMRLVIFLWRFLGKAWIPVVGYWELFVHHIVYTFLLIRYGLLWNRFVGVSLYKSETILLIGVGGHKKKTFCCGCLYYLMWFVELFFTWFLNFYFPAKFIYHVQNSINTSSFSLSHGTTCVWARVVSPKYIKYSYVEGNIYKSIRIECTPYPFPRIQLYPREGSS